MDVMDTIQSCLGDVIIITTIAMYSYLGIVFAGLVYRRFVR